MTSAAPRVVGCLELDRFHVPPPPPQDRGERKNGGGLRADPIRYHSQPFQSTGQLSYNFLNLLEGAAMRMKLSQMWTALEIREGLRMMHEAKAVPLTIVMTSAVFEDFVRKVNEIMHGGETVTDGKRPTLFGLSVVVRDDMPDGMDWFISQDPPWKYEGEHTVVV